MSRPAYDPRLRVIDGAKGPVRLSRSEALLWEALSEAGGAPVEREDLMRRSELSGPRAVDFAIRRLRAKIEADPERPRSVLTVHGTGYQLATSAPPPAPASRARRPIGAAEIDLEIGFVWTAQGSRALSPAERDLLRLLLDAPGLVERERSRGRSLREALRSLRALIEPDPEHPIYLLSSAEGVRLRATDPRASHLIGRQNEIEAVCASLARERIAAVTGPTGIGKSALLREVSARAARDLPGGVFGIDAARCLSVESLLAAALAALGSPRSVRPSRATLAARLSRMPPLLIVIDHAEEIARGELPLFRVLAELLDQRHVRFLVASERLDTASWAAHAVRLRGLSVEEGIALYRSVAAASGATLAPADDALIERAVAAVDGAPLGITLLARKAATDPPSSWSSRGDMGWIDVLNANERWIDAALGWSWRRASAEQRRVLRDCQIFEEPFSLLAASAVCGADEALLRELLDQGWLEIFSEAPVRYKLSALLHTLLASIQLRPDAAVASAHAHYFFSQAAGTVGLWRTPRQPEMDAIAAHKADLIAAYRRLGEPEKRAPIAILLHRFRAPEADAMLESLCESPEPFPSKAALWLCRARRAPSDADTARMLTGALAAGLPPDDSEYVNLLSYIHPETPYPRPSGSQAALSNWLSQQAQLSIVRGDLDRAELLLTEASQVAARSGDSIGQLAIASIQASLDARRERPFGEISERLAAISSRWEAAFDLQSAARAAIVASFLGADEPARARALADRALSLAIEVGDEVLENNALLSQAWASIGEDPIDAWLAAVSVAAASASGFVSPDAIAQGIALEALIRASVGETVLALARLDRTDDRIGPGWRALLATMACALDASRPFPQPPAGWFGRLCVTIRMACEGHTEEAYARAGSHPFARRMVTLAARTPR